MKLHKWLGLSKEQQCFALQMISDGSSIEEVSDAFLVSEEYLSNLVPKPKHKPRKKKPRNSTPKGGK